MAGDEGYVGLARRLQDAGAAAVTIHARTASQGFRGEADWRHIARVVEALDVPVIGNGDVTEPADAARMFEETGCDAVMIGEAAMGRPWIFRQVTALMEKGQAPSPPQEEILGILLQHHRGLVEHHGEGRGTIMMRKQSCHYAKHLTNGKSFNQAVIRRAAE